MATVQHKPRQGATNRPEAYVEGQLHRARQRIRLLDAIVGLLGLAVGTLVYAVVMAVLDRWLELSPLARQAAFAGYAVTAGLWAWFGLVLPLIRPLNPYYAARQIEQSIPDAKNSVVNWLDLHDRNLPPAIRTSLGNRAARDLAKVDLEQAISGRRAAWLGGATGGLLVVMFVLLAIFGGAPFFSHLGRAFAPFGDGLIATRTRIEIVRPEAGDATVPVDQAVQFFVNVHGRVPEPNRRDSLRLLYRYQLDEPYEERSLERESGREWYTTLPAFQVQNGFYYKIVGGDYETPEYRVKVRAAPLVTGIDILYRYRPYLGWPDETTRDPNLKAIRGTEVKLTAHTNRVVRIRNSVLELELENGKKTVAAEAVDDDPQAMRFTVVLDRDGSYRVRFTDDEGAVNPEPLPYTIKVIPDFAPTVELTLPGRDTVLPANGLLKLEGSAGDDLGVKSMTLRMQVGAERPLQPKAYREGKDFRLEEGGYPRALAYKDFVDLATLKDAEGKPFTPPAGTQIDYWLEAADACDFPTANVGASKHYKVTIAPADPDAKKMAEERQQAEQEQKQHEGDQDRKNGQQKQDGGEQGNEPKPGMGEPMPGGKQEGGQEQPMPGAQPDQAGKPMNDEQARKDEDLQKQAERLADAARRNQEQGGQGEKNEQPQPRGDGKPDQQPKQDEGKDGNQAGERPQGGEGKGMNPQEPQPQPGQEKPDGAGEQQGQPKDDQAQPQGGEKAGQGKPGGKGAGKPPDDPQNPDEALRRLNDRPHDGKPREKDNSPPEGSSKDDPQRLTRRMNDDPQGGNSQGGAKKGGKPDQGGQARADGNQKEMGEGGDSKPEDAKKEDVDRLAKKRRSKDSKEREQAKKDLDKVRREARDPAARDAAEQAQKDAEQEERLAREKNEDQKPGPQDGQPCSKCKGGGNNSGNGTGKGGGTERAQGDAKGGDKEGQLPQAANAKDANGENPGGRVEDGGPQRAGEGGERVQDTKPEGDPNPEHASKASVLQLEEFKKLVDKKVLADAKMSPEQFQEFLKGWAELLRRKGLERRPDEKLPAPQQAGRLPTTGAREVTRSQAKTGDVRFGGTGQPPPEFREAFKEFTRKLSDADRK